MNLEPDPSLPSEVDDPLRRLLAKWADRRRISTDAASGIRAVIVETRVDACPRWHVGFVRDLRAATTQTDAAMAAVKACLKAVHYAALPRPMPVPSVGQEYRIYLRPG